MQRIKIFVFLFFVLFSISFYGYQWMTPQVSGQGGGVGSLFPPNGVTASDGHYADKIGVMWELVRGATSYRIYRATTNNQASATDVGTTQANYFFDMTPDANQNYFYWVRAESADASSILSLSEQGLRANGTNNPDPFFPTLNPPPAPTGNDVTASKAALGKALFWDEQMSSTMTVSCGTCHRPAEGGSDPRTAVNNLRSQNPGFDNTFNTADDVFGSPGVPLNNADGSYSFSNSFGLSEQVTGRKSPSYLNAGYSFNGLFWDGRATDAFRDPITNAVVLPSFASLESQVLGPPLSSGEMSHGGRNWTQAAAQIAGSKPLALATNIPRSLTNWINGRTYPQLFEEAFGTADVTPARIAMAIATHERTLFSDQTPLDKWSAQIAQLTAQEERGRNIFRGSCTICHVGPVLSNQQFHNIGVRPATEDSGRAAITGNSEDNARFKTPNLRNVELHAPYMHNGRFATLEEVVEFYDRGGDFPNAPNMDIEPLGLSNQQKADLVAFMKRPMTDVRVANELPPFDRPKLYSESPRVPIITGTGRAGSGGLIPKVTAVEPPYIGNMNFTVGVSQVLSNAQGYLVIDTTDPGAGASIPQAGAFPRFQFGTSGTGNNGYASVSFELPNNPDLIGQSFYGRWYVIDPVAANGFSVSPPFRFTLFSRATVLNKTHTDFDGDGKTDVSIFRPSNGQWWIYKSSNNGNAAFQFGASTDKLVPADYTGDGKTDVAIFRPSNGEWYILRSEDSSYYSFPFGTKGDIPAPGDFDADGKADQAVFRPSTATWYIYKSTGGTYIQTFGVPGDIPQIGDYDADGKADIAIYRPSNGQWWLSRSTLGVMAATFGVSTDKPVAADFTGDGKTDIAIWRPSSGEWFVLRSEDGSYYSFPFGTVGDIPSPGNYDGDGRADAAVFRPSGSTWYINGSTQGFTILNFGQSGDYPVPAAYVP